MGHNAYPAERPGDPYYCSPVRYGRRRRAEDAAEGEVVGTRGYLVSLSLSQAALRGWETRRRNLQAQGRRLARLIRGEGHEDHVAEEAERLRKEQEADLARIEEALRRVQQEPTIVITGTQPADAPASPKPVEVALAR